MGLIGTGTTMYHLITDSDYRKNALHQIITDLAVSVEKYDVSGLFLTDVEKERSVYEKLTKEIRVISNISHEAPPLINIVAKQAQTQDVESEDLVTVFRKLKNHKDYPLLKTALKGSIGPYILPTILPIIAQQSPLLARVIKSDKQAFLKMINDDYN